MRNIFTRNIKPPTSQIREAREIQAANDRAAHAEHLQRQSERQSQHIEIITANLEIQELTKTNNKLRETKARLESQANNAVAYTKVLDQVSNRETNEQRQKLMKWADNYTKQSAPTESKAFTGYGIKTLKDAQGNYVQELGYDPKTKELTGGNNFYHVVKQKYFIALLEDGTVVVKPVDSMFGFKPLTPYGKFTSDSVTGQLSYANIPRAEFDAIIKTQPSFADLKKAYQLLTSPRFDLSTLDAVPLFSAGENKPQVSFGG